MAIRFYFTKTTRSTSQVINHQLSTKEKIKLNAVNIKLNKVTLTRQIGVSKNVIKQYLATLKKAGVFRQKESIKVGYTGK